MQFPSWAHNQKNITAFRQHNDDETYTTVRSDKIPGWKSALSQIEKIFGKEFKDTVKLSSKVFNQKQEECVDICICCQKPPSLLAPGSQLMNCATCKKAGRTSRYCSKYVTTVLLVSSINREVSSFQGNVRKKTGSPEGTKKFAGKLSSRSRMMRKPHSKTLMVKYQFRIPVSKNLLPCFIK